MECTHWPVINWTWATIFNINMLQTCCFMYNIIRVAIPLYLFVLNNQVHAHNTLQSERLHLISHNTNVRAFSFQVHGVKLWNDVRLYFTNCIALGCFKIKYKRSLINKWLEYAYVESNYSYFILSSKVCTITIIYYTYFIFF